MRRDDGPTVWKAEPHTLAKIRILEDYLVAWFQILGVSRAEPLVFIDGFAGPGRYTNHPTGSPVAALRAATTALTNSAARWRSRGIHCLFVEGRKDRYEHLRAHLSGGEVDRRIEVTLLQGTFVDALDQVRTEKPDVLGGGNPLFAFIDPFGTRGAPFAAIESLLSSPRSEILLNLDADGIARILSAGSSAGSAGVLNETFGGRHWEGRLSSGKPFSALCQEVLRLYKDRLRAIPGVRFTFAFEMRSRLDQLNYFLLFASQNRLGLTKMKEAMRRVDQTGDYCFADATARTGQASLFRFDDSDAYIGRLAERFAGQVISYDDVTRLRQKVCKRKRR